MTYDMRGVF